MAGRESFLESLLQGELQQIESVHLLRRRRVVRPIDAVHLEIDGRTCVNFCSNNYLGLSFHPRLIAAVSRAMGTHGFGSGAAGLITGHTGLHAQAERAIAQWKRTQSSLLFPSGYQANSAAIQTLAALMKRVGGGRFLVDKLVHASLLDAVAASGLTMRVFPHNGVKKLQRLLSDGSGGGMDVVVTESIFSMDGDAADLEGIVALKGQHSFVLLLDEAHGSGVYGELGAGLAQERGVGADVDVTVVTLSKALGGSGGAVCGSELFYQALVNLGRAYIYSTSVPAAVAVAAQTAIEIIADEPQRQRRVRELSLRVRRWLADRGLKIPAGDSPIIPVIVGSAEKAMEASERLLRSDMLVIPVRPPTVPRGSSRLRVTLSCEHSDEEVDRLCEALAEM